MAKYLFIDLETTGDDYRVHGIHQISGMVVINGRIAHRFNFRVKPHSDCPILDKALEVSGTTREQLASFQEPRVVKDQLMAIMAKYVSPYERKDKFYLVGYNIAAFDAPFLRKWFERCHDKYFGSWFWSAPIDVMVLAALRLRDDRPEMDNFQLATVAKWLGIEVDDSKLHDAEYDMDLTAKVYQASTGMRIVIDSAPPAQ